jgi:hypothetical protein
MQPVCVADETPVRRLSGVDNRTKQAKRLRELIGDFERDVGGRSHLSAVQRATLRNAASITFQLETMTAAAVRGDPVDGDLMIRLSNTARRLLHSLPRRESANPALVDYLASKRPAI